MSQWNINIDDNCVVICYCKSMCVEKEGVCNSHDNGGDGPGNGGGLGGGGGHALVA